MNLKIQLEHESAAFIGVARSERVLRLCQTARQLEEAGEYESACEVLREFWPDRREPSALETLDEPTRAEVLLRIGALAGWVGSANQFPNSQESAKNLITKSIEIFKRLGELKRVAEARTDLAVCYWREVGFDEAQINLKGVLDNLTDGDDELRAIALMRAGMVEITAGRLNDALRLYGEAKPLLERSKDHALKGRFHNHLAVLLKNLGRAEGRSDYFDRALMEFTAASYHFEQAGHIRYGGCTENNLGSLFLTIGRLDEAHRHLDRARSLLLDINDTVHVAQVDDTRARVFLGEGRIVEAERFARSAVKTLEKGGEQSLLAEALTTYGTALARRGKPIRSKAALQRAIEVAETSGDLEAAGRARLTMIEELGVLMSREELASIHKDAVDLLKSSQDPSIKERLLACASKVVDALRIPSHKPSSNPAASDEQPDWEGFSLKKELLRHERNLIERALVDARGSVTRAAQLLGCSHQGLIAVINGRHKMLTNFRSPARPRKRSIISHKKRKKRASYKGASEITILHVEQNDAVATLLKGKLAQAGMSVDTCVDGRSALKVLKGNAYYSLLVFDNDAPELNALELVRRVRKMSHRRRIPIIMISGSEDESDAWRAGVAAFLRKPEDINEVSTTIARLLKDDSEDHHQGKSFASAGKTTSA
jgi:CheY-like chemotaxis protein